MRLMNAERFASGMSPFCRDSSRPAGVLALATFLVTFAAGCGRVDMGPESHVDGGSEDTGVLLVDASGADLGDLGSVLDAESASDAIVEPLDAASAPDAAACAEGDPECEEPVEDVDECSGGTDECEPEATCVNTFGSYLCTCPMSGFVATGRGCADVDECTSGAASCSPNSTCQNTPGRYECPCDAGFAVGLGGACVNTDECLLEMDDCGAHSSCRDTAPGYVCDCDPGYAPDPGGARFCVNVNECDTDNGGCGDGIECIDTDGSYSCGGCLRGFAPDPLDPESCVDIDECSLSTYPCDINADCINQPGSFSCTCADGYEGPGTSCSNINECAIGGYCSPLVACTDSPGSYTCGACPAGYLGDGRTCTDVDECETTECARETACVNTPGSYACSCPEGYVGDDFGGCTPRPIQIAGGLGFACGRFGEGSVYCWGLGEQGQLGNSTAAAGARFSTPTTRVSGLTSAATKVVAGSAFACALLLDGTVRCWGADDFGQLGDDATLAAKSTSVAVSGIAGATDVAAHSEHACAVLTGGAVRCWGRNDFGQIGDGSQTHRATPVAVVGLPAAVAVTTSSSHSCAILAEANRRIVCWGANDFGQLGDDSEVALRTTAGSPSMYSVYDGLNEVRDARAVVSSHKSSCALLGSGRVQCWGSNQNGELGQATSASFSRLSVVVDGLNDATSIAGSSSSGRTFCVTRAGSSPECWGLGTAYRRGDGLSTAGSNAVPVRGAVVGVPNAESIGLSHGAGFAILPNGGVRSWGQNYGGVVGDGASIATDVSATAARALAGPMSSVYDAVAITTGTASACTLRRDGRVQCWGYGAHGRLGNGSTTNRTSAQDVLGITNATALDSHAYGACTLLATGKVMCWGLNYFNMISGSTAVTTNVSSPQEIVGLPSDVVQVDTGSYHVCARTAGGDVWCWGRNDRGQVGNGTTKPTTGVDVDGMTKSYMGVATPTKVGLPAGRTAVDLALSALASCVLLDDGAVYCFGANDGANRRLGVVNGSGVAITTTDVLTASRVGSLPLSGEVVTEIDGGAGGSVFCARFASKKMACWGYGWALGRGSVALFNSPNADYVLDAETSMPLERVVSVAVGATSSCVSLEDGTVRCWGLNDTGQLGDGTTTNRGSATRVVSVEGAVQASTMATSGYCAPFACALLADHSVRCWGRNRFGELGTGYTTLQGAATSTACGAGSASVIPEASHFPVPNAVSSFWRN